LVSIKELYYDARPTRSQDDHLSCYSFSFPCKGKAIPLQAWTGPEIYRSIWLLYFKTIGTWMW